MEKWEYLTRFMSADVGVDGVREYLEKRWPNWKPSAYAPQAMMYELNLAGDEGWEVVSMQPVIMGNNGDVGFVHGGTTRLTTWSHVYFVVMKRRKPE